MIEKIRIHEIANELGITSKDVVEKASELGIEVKSAQSTVTIQEAESLMNFIMNSDTSTQEVEVKASSSSKSEIHKAVVEKEEPSEEKYTDDQTNNGETKMTKEELANEMGVGIDMVTKICKDLGIENTEITKEAQVDIKIKYLALFKKKLIDQNTQFKQEKTEFEKYMKEQKQALEEKLIEEELKHKTKLEEQKIKTLTQLKDEFLKSIKTDYEKIHTKLDDLIQKELKLTQWQQELNQSEKMFSQAKEIFESQKEKVLNEYKEEIANEKEIFTHRQEAQKVSKLEEINKIIEELYKTKEIDINKKEESIIQKESKLKIQENEILAKEKYLESQEDLLYKQAKEKVSEEIKTYQDKLKYHELEIQKLKEELFDLKDELDEHEKFKDRDLPQELKEKNSELRILKEKIEEIRKQKREIESKKEIDFLSFEVEMKNLYQENQNFRIEIESIEQLRSENNILSEKLKEISFLKSENQILQNRLDSMNQLFTQSKEKELRVEDIRREPFLKRELDSEINVTDEIKYLDSIESNMKTYGVEYPRRLLNAFHTALKSAEYSPLTVLAGVSGTGKSELPKLYSHFGGFNFLAEAVQPTWDSPESMLGYYNTIENKFDSSNILKFLLQTAQSKNDSQFGWQESMNMILLDEMNLSHIELYFAEFLSKFELRRGKDGVNLDIKLGAGMNYPLPLDRNVLWIGTMNEDETTKALSDKVLDRSFAINFPRPDKLLSRGKLKTLDEIKKFEYLNRDTWNKWLQKESVFTKDNIEVLYKYKDIANKINDYLTPTGRAIGHRVWQSMEYYINNHPLVIQNIHNEDELALNVKYAFEEQLVQKIMPKLRGIETHGKEKEVLHNIREIIHQNDFKITEDFELSMDNPYGQFIWNSANYLKED
ncbi:protein containing Translation initiation factor IF-2, N-terminal domain [Sulfurimonas gotlandica GD1]|uniref:Protein containing Translation initiation factor IF-2, N-terminal domain n=1 Tax=Sulfurimonas gotlandica (strain DSM 19862 / JCM 16533 / GD1) TaxID=929558 RepID=B6BJ47_SULGG|nr:translation initiation factor IF-2 N-terminal domain-containing protein [Sulfurimonas gotlandica]EDZ63352.1 translation initiation factor IF-2, N-terminal domain protein [Sulfurimonas gotlandica GD1]EHP30562.1 protein containing Translation initiation factor IF-2, N-terminal domain [Sulfurimonas gotlandica GD1]